MAEERKLGAQKVQEEKVLDTLCADVRQSVRQQRGAHVTPDRRKELLETYETRPLTRAERIELDPDYYSDEERQEEVDDEREGK